MKIFNFLLSVFYSVGLLGLFVFVGLIILNSGDSVLIKIGVGIVLLLGIISSIWLFKVMHRKGAINLLGETRASYDLDHAMHQNDPNVSFGTVKEWVKNLNEGRTEFNGGQIRIWGFGTDYDLDKFHELLAPELISNKLTIPFKNGNQLQIDGANRLYYSETFIKFLEASRIIWNWGNDRKSIEFSYDGSFLFASESYWTGIPLCVTHEDYLTLKD